MVSTEKYGKWISASWTHMQIWGICAKSKDAQKIHLVTTTKASKIAFHAVLPNAVGSFIGIKVMNQTGGIGLNQAGLLWI